MSEPGIYQPFLIGEGKSTTGYFTYLDSWVKPETAYDTLVNAYVYRGSLYQRNGFTLFPSTPANGALLYQNNEIVATGNGGSTYSGTLANFPLIATATITAKTASGIRTSTASFAAGNVAWSTGGSSLATAGTLNFTTGVWSITTSATVANNIPITIQYTFIPTALTSNAGGPVNNPIMGIKQFINETTDTNVLLVLDTKRASYWDSGSTQFQPLSEFQQYFYQFPDPNIFTKTNNNAAILLQWTNIAPYSITVVSSGDANGNGTVTDVPTNSTTGTFTSNGNISGGSINYVTGAIIINFTLAPTARTLVQVTANVQDNYFTGDNTNFFNSVNWDAPDVPAYLYVTNNVDNITTFNGTFLARPPFALYSTSVTIAAPSQVLLPYRNDVKTCLDVKVFQNSLLLLRPTIYNDDAGHSLKSFAENQAIYWSCPNGNLSFTPTNFVQPNPPSGNGIAGNGGQAPATTGDILMASQLLRDVLVVFFTNSTWLFRATGNFADPFRFYQLNVSRSTNAPYGSSPDDVVARSMGGKGLIQCDGVGVQRYDEKVIDLFEDINQNSFGQCFAQRYDAQNQTWMLYPSASTNQSTSDRIMIYNYLEDTWAIYEPNLGVNLSCLGLGFTTKDATWNDLGPGGIYGGPTGLTWAQANFPWNNFVEQDLAPSLLAGDQNGFVYIADNGPTDNLGPASTVPNPIPAQVVTKRLSPFLSGGQKSRFGYLDVYYEVNAGAQISLNIYVNNSTVVYRSFTFTLDASTNQDSNWKRFYINATGEFLQVEFNSLIKYVNNVPQYNPGSPFKILGMVLWASPGGRLTPGTFL